MLMASLGKNVFDGTEFAPFASHLIIELYEIVDGENGPLTDELKNLFPTKKAFRLLYNGKLLTSKVKGCQSDLVSDVCDISKLIAQTKPFAVLERDCAKTTQGHAGEDENEKYDDEDQANSNNNTEKTTTKADARRSNFTGGVLFFTSMISGTFGSLATYYYINKNLPFGGPMQQRRVREYDTFDRNIVTGSPRAETELPDLS